MEPKIGLSQNMLMDNRLLSVSNDSKALYFYLLLFKDHNNQSIRSYMIDYAIHVTSENYIELEKAGLISVQGEKIKFMGVK